MEEQSKLLSTVAVASYRPRLHFEKHNKAKSSSGVPTASEKQRRNDKKKRLEAEQDQWKSELMKFYSNPAVPTQAGFSLRCMATGIEMDKQHITAAHLHSKEERDSMFHVFAIHPHDFRSARMGLLLAENIESAYDALDVCFKPVPLQPSTLVLTVLNKDVLDQRIAAPSKMPTFKQVDGRSFVLPNRPFMRLISFQYETAMENAFLYGWISEEEFKARPRYGDPSPNYLDRMALLSACSEKCVSSLDLNSQSDEASTSPQDMKTKDAPAADMKRAPKRRNRRGKK